MTEAESWDYYTVKAMAEVIHQADKGTNLDSSPSYVRDRYHLLAEAVLRYNAETRGVLLVEPISGFGWHPKRQQVVVGDTSDSEPPVKCQPVFRVVDPGEPTPTQRAYGS